MHGLSGDIDTDVLVIGLGPAGASAAAAVARGGRRAVAVDRKAEAGVPVQCAEFVPAMIGQQVGDLAAARTQRIGEMVTYVETDEAERTPNFRGSMISRADFDRHLVAQAAHLGAICHFGAQVRAMDADGTVTLASGGRITARVIIGADGPRSAAGRAIGQLNRDCVETRQITVALLQPHCATDIFLSAEIPGGYGWLFPTRDRANLGLGVAPAWKPLLKPMLDKLHRHLVAKRRVGAQVLGLTGGLIPVGGLRDPVGRLGAADVLLAGDAAGLTNPVTGAGISAAVLSGQMAGEAAVALLAGKRDAARKYHDELEEVFGPALRRALIRRQDLTRRYSDGGAPAPDDLRAAWIAYPQYWGSPRQGAGV